VNPETRTGRTASGSAEDAQAALLAEIAGDVAAVESAIESVAAAPAGYVKRLRPALVLLAGRAVDPSRTGEVHARLGAVVELIHTATLVHDDILDGALLRRRRPTLHRMEGMEVAVLLGDFLLASAYAEAASISDRMASRYLAEVTRQVCQGEVLQVHERGNLDLAESTYLEIIEKKTAVLYAASCHVGAYYAAGDADTVGALQRYGRDIGMAFQIVDDVLDLVGDEAEVGKSLGTDLARQKMTLPLLGYFRTGPRDEVERVRAALAAGRGAESVSWIREAVLASGSVDAARRRAEEYVASAVAELEILPRTPARETLRRIAGYVLVRRR
jgi:octaprenyl-diphosphate synthase